MRKTLYLAGVLTVVMILVAACGGGAQTGGSGGGNADAGKTLFAKQAIGGNPGCVNCHTLDGSVLVGPSLKGIGSRAGGEVQGQTADQYVRDSILNPNAHAAGGFATGIMPSYKSELSDAQLNDLVAYLLSLK